MGFVQDFKKFALKDNVVELAVAVVIGAAFGDIVSSLVEDVITPLILIPATEAAGVADIDQLSWKAVKYGKLVSAIIKFILIALSLFMVTRLIQKIDRSKESK
ncbi:MAG: large conductance mechanosensitive channel protein MscL [Bacteroidetes bacterium]|nr:large conductance mechanosensitive channel protein MscL [Bacteroidota bacterium]